MDLVAYYRQQRAWRDWRTAMEALPELEGRRVLDLGCGIGDQAELLIARGAHVVGFDANADVIAAARARRLANGEFHEAELRALPSLASRFDGIWSSFTAAYFPKLAPVLASWSASLRDGGWIALTEIDDFFGHEPLGARSAELLANYASDALRAERYDFSMGRKLTRELAAAGFVVETTLELADAELAFDGPARTDVVMAWRTRLDGMQLLRTHCGPEFECVRDEFLACLAAADHRARARVLFVLARKPPTG